MKTAIRSLATLMIGILLAIGIAGPAGAKDMPFDSKIRLKNSFPAFHGKVSSGIDYCVDNRKVRLFKVKPGDDKVLGKTRTDGKGKWQVLKDPKSGVYYAKVNQYADQSLERLCLAAKSKKVVID